MRCAAAAAAQPSTTIDATHAPPRMPAARSSSTSHTAAAIATSAICRRSSDSAPSSTSNTKIPSANPATPPGDGDTGSDVHCAANTIGTSIRATPRPAQRAAGPRGAHRDQQRRRARRPATQDRQQHPPVRLRGGKGHRQPQRQRRADAGQAHLRQHARRAQPLRLQRLGDQRSNVRGRIVHGPPPARSMTTSIRNATSRASGAGRRDSRRCSSDHTGHGSSAPRENPPDAG